MYVILAYDIGVERIDIIRNFLKQYLNWVQNSVFEGEITKAQLYKIQGKLKSLIDKERDNILIYTARDQRFINRLSLGTVKAEVDNIL